MNESGGYETVEPMPNIGKRIKLLRESVPDRTQAEFGVLLGVSRGAVGNWELGRGIKTENLILMAQKTGAPMDWLSGSAGDDDVLPVANVELPPPTKAPDNGPVNFYQIAIDETLRAVGVRVDLSAALAVMIEQVAVSRPPGYPGMSREETTRLITRRRAELILTSQPDRGQ